MQALKKKKKVDMTQPSCWTHFSKVFETHKPLTILSLRSEFNEQNIFSENSWLLVHAFFINWLTRDSEQFDTLQFVQAKTTKKYVINHIIRIVHWAENPHCTQCPAYYEICFTFLVLKYCLLLKFAF